MLENDRLLRACRRQPVDRTPVWFMRQAGRYQPEYRAIRQKYTLLEICQHPEVCAEVTLLPPQQFGLDAAILFSDIMVPIQAMGMNLDIKEGVGPVMDRALRSEADLAALRPLNAQESLPHVLETIRILHRELKVPLIGFAGGPFTLASYMVEGKPSRDYMHTKNMMYSAPGLWHSLMDKLATMIGDYLVEQVRAGCQVVQIFESWVGALSQEDYNQYLKPYMAAIVQKVQATGAPVIYYGVTTGHLLSSMAEVGADVIGADWREPIDLAWQKIGDKGIQGNLDSTLLFAPPEVYEARTLDILRRVNGRPGHIFNLGHGILPGTPVDSVKRVAEVVHSFDPASVALQAEPKR